MINLNVITGNQYELVVCCTESELRDKNKVGQEGSEITPMFSPQKLVRDFKEAHRMTDKAIE